LDSFWNKFARLSGELKDALYNSLIKLGFPNDAISVREALGLISSLNLSEKYVLVIDDCHMMSSTCSPSFPLSL
jgi:LuxR family maltose regulon positive regulatory protein